MTRDELNEMIYGLILYKTEAGSITHEDVTVAIMEAISFCQNLAMNPPAPPTPTLESVLGAGATVMEGEIELQSEITIGGSPAVQKTVFFGMGVVGKTDTADQCLNMMPQAGCGVDVNFVLPAVASGTHTLVTRTDLISRDIASLSVDFSRTVAHTAATLNSAYPLPPTGFTAFCLAVSGGAKAYRYIGGSWISFSIAAVA